MSERPTHLTASGLARAALCPGSWRLEKGQSDKPTVDSIRGDDIHYALAHRKPDNSVDTEHGAYTDLTEDEKTCVDILAAREAKLVASLCETHGQPTRIEREKRYFICEDQGQLSPVFSAQLDAVYIWETHALIIDYKSGWGDIDEAPGNHQILGQVAAFTGKVQGYDMLYAAIIQPSSEPEIAGYTMPQQIEAEQKVLEIIDATESPDAPLVPGETQCKYCKAAAICPALGANAMSLASKPIHPPEFEVMQPEALSYTLERCVLADRFIEAVRSEARKRLNSGQEVPGWELAPGATRRIITDAQKALEAVTPHGVSVDDVLSCVTVKTGELEEKFKAATGFKGKTLTAEFNAALEGAGCLELKSNEPSLKRTKKTIE